MASNGSGDGRDRKRKEATNSFYGESTYKTSKHMLEQSPLESTKSGNEFQDIMSKKERNHHRSIISRQTHKIDEGSAGGKMYDFGSSNSDKALKVSIDLNNGEYALKLMTVKTNNATEEEAHTAAVLLSQAEAAVLRELGEKLLSHIRSRI